MAFRMINLSVLIMTSPKHSFKASLFRLAAKLLARLVPKGVFANKNHFEIWQAAGFHVVPNHFYEPIPDTRNLDPKLWDAQKQSSGIAFHEEEQLALLTEFTVYREEYEALFSPQSNYREAFKGIESLFGPVDAEVLYCMVRHFKPRKILEIGSGFSTRISSLALLKNQALGAPLGELVAIEPYPNEAIRQGFPGLARLEQVKIQDFSLAEFEALQPNDIVFIDSSHVFKLGSDVQHEFQEILPRIPPGVLVHFHDIFLPSEYPREWIMDKHLFWNEQYFLHSFLLFNDSFKVLWGGSCMHLKHADSLAKAFKRYNSKTNWPGSFWMRRN